MSAQPQPRMTPEQYLYIPGLRTISYGDRRIPHLPQCIDFKSGKV